MNVTALYFSPTGGSKRSALSLAAALAPEGFAELDITCGAAAGDFAVRLDPFDRTDSRAGPEVCP